MTKQKTSRIDEVNDLLAEFYNYEIPSYVKEVSTRSITIVVSDIITDRPKRLKVKISDVVKYYKYQAGNIVSGCRKLAGYVGDWRPIDNLANECLEWFKFVNKDGLRRAAIKEGLTPKF